MVGGSTTNCGGSQDPVAHFDVTSAVANRSDNLLTFRLAADDESDKYAYKRFAGWDTQLHVEYDNPPDTPKSLSIAPDTKPSFCGGDMGWFGAQVGDFTVSAHVSDQDTDSNGNGQSIHALFSIADWSDLNNPNVLVSFSDSNAVGGNVIGSGTSNREYALTLKNGHRYRINAESEDPAGLRSDAEGFCTLAVDNQNPNNLNVTSSDFNLSNSTKHAGQAGSFNLSASDPVPADGGMYSKIDHFTWSAKSAADLDGDGGHHVPVSPSGSNASTTISFTPTAWGINYLYVAAVDNAGNESNPKTYEYYVPDDPTPGVPGDVDGDRHPDVLAADAKSGNLLLLPTNTTTLPSTPVLASNAVNSPTGASWANTLIAHRSSDKISSTGTHVDDLWALHEGDPALFLYTNNYNNAGGAGSGAMQYTRDNARNVTRPSCAAGATACAGYASTWANVTQLIAPGNIDRDANSTPDLLTVETPVGGGSAQLWFFPGQPGGTLGPAQLVNTGSNGTILWDRWRLIAPGDATGDEEPDLMAAPTDAATTTDLHMWPVTVTSNGSNVQLGPLVADSETSFSSSARPLITSPGYVDGDGMPDLYSVWTDGTAHQLWQNLATASDYTTYHMGVHTVVDDGTGAYDWSKITNLS